MVYSLARASGLHASTRDDGRLQLDPPRGCGCLFVIGDVASGDWTLMPDFREHLAQAIQFAVAHTKKLRFSATWMGDAAPQVEDLDAGEMIVRIREGRLSGRCLYVVMSGPGHR